MCFRHTGTYWGSGGPRAQKVSCALVTFTWLLSRGEFTPLCKTRRRFDVTGPVDGWPDVSGVSFKRRRKKLGSLTVLTVKQQQERGFVFRRGAAFAATAIALSLEAIRA